MSIWNAVGNYGMIGCVMVFLGCAIVAFMRTDFGMLVPGIIALLAIKPFGDMLDDPDLVGH